MGGVVGRDVGLSPSHTLCVTAICWAFIMSMSVRVRGWCGVGGLDKGVGCVVGVGGYILSPNNYPHCRAVLGQLRPQEALSADVAEEQKVTDAY